MSNPIKVNHQDTKTPRYIPNISQDLDSLGRVIVDCMFQVHKEMGPGLLESVYEDCFSISLRKKNIFFQSQKAVPLTFLGEVVENPLRLDFLIDDKIIVELKSVERILPVHEAQLLSYMKLANCRLGYLVNFNVPLIKDGIFRRAL